ncbi:hypothetical protein [Streptomyces sp. NPDC050804]|uniref:hypothetical protein n=1 Tax=Streptomyces sp. NPDC050804 TaxID=3154745 RepID=UPI0034479E9B
MRATDEEDPCTWKRFSDSAYLRVNYNRPPSQIKVSRLTMDPGGTCVKADKMPRVRSLPTLRVDNATDPDGDRVSVQFQALWDTGDGRKPYVPLRTWTATTTTRRPLNRCGTGSAELQITREHCKKPRTTVAGDH